MTDASRLLDSVTSDEAYKITPYKDTKGLWTFGIGRCLETHPLTAAEWKYLLDNGFINVSIGKVGAQWMATCELATVEHSLRSFPWFSQIGDVRQNAFIEMAYQMGLEHFNGFHQMIGAAGVGDWAEVQTQALDSKWAREDSPARARYLANMLLTGQWT